MEAVGESQNASVPVAGMGDYIKNQQTIDFAEQYFENGWRVFPIHRPIIEDGRVRCGCGGEACTSYDRHPAIKQFNQRATKNPDVLRGWTEQFPGMNIGLSTGKATGILVVDVDNHGDEQGNESLKRLLEGHRTFSEKFMVKTGTGRHYYFKTDTDYPSGYLRGYPGIEIKCKGRWVTAPPSQHNNGGFYEWAEGPVPEDLPAVPGWLADIPVDRTKQRPKGGETAGKVGDLVGITKGTRNTTLLRIDGFLRTHGVCKESRAICLEIINVNDCLSEDGKLPEPLSETEVARILKSSDGLAQGHPTVAALDAVCRLQKEKAGPSQRAVLNHLILRAKKTDWTCLRSVGGISRETGLSRSTVSRATKTLRENGFLAWELVKTPWSKNRMRNYTIDVRRIFSEAGVDRNFDQESSNGEGLVN